MSKLKPSSPPSASGSAAPTDTPTFRSNPEVDAKIDAHIKENPKYWTYVQAMPRERLERSVVLNEVRELDRQQRIREGVLKQINRNPEMKRAYELLVKDLPEDQKEGVIAQIGRTARRAVARVQGQQQTKGEFICDLAKKSLQTLVLSHDPHFLRDLWGSAHGTIPKSLQLSRMGDGTNISEWDIENETRGDYEKTHRELWSFVHRGEGDPKSVARAIRPLFEKYLRLKLPNEFPDNEWLGELIKRIRNSAPIDAIAAAKVILDEVEAINDYSKRYHHNTNAQSESETVDSNELAAFVDRTLKLVGGF